MKTSSVVVATIATIAFALPASAHIQMSFPTPRFNDGQNKWCPCGTGGDGTRANNGCGISKSDPNRGPTSNAFTAGQTITLAWTETVDHVGRFRVSFDPDGADQDDFDANVLADIPDPSGNGGAHTLDVTLPNVNCSNCTLQLIQVMNGDTVDAVATPVNSYFQCANLVLTGASGGEGEGEGASSGEGEGEGASSSEGEGEGASSSEGEGEGASSGEGEGASSSEGEGEGATPGATAPSCGASHASSRSPPIGAAFAIVCAFVVVQRRRRSIVVGTTLVVAMTIGSSSAQAHIALTDPPNRYGSNGVDGLNKMCPCGSAAFGGAQGDQYCSNGVTSDGNRSSSVTTYAPGETITVTWIETVAHSGRMRVAFDDDGADLADFNKNVLADITDPSGATGKHCTVRTTPTDVDCTDASDSTWTATFTLPSTPCANCTLQVIQDMSGDTTDPVADPSGDRTYFQCADLVLQQGADPGGHHDPAVGPTKQDKPTGCASTSTSSGASIAVLAIGLGALRRRRHTSAR